MDLDEILGNSDLADSFSGMDLSEIDLDNLDWDTSDMSAAELEDLGRDGSPDDDAGAEDTAASPDDPDDDDSDEDDDDDGFFDGLGNLFSPQLLIGLAALAALLGAAVYAQRMLGRSRDDELEDDVEAEPEAPVAALDAEAGLTASLDEAQESGDPRQRIMAAYMRLLEALAAAGAPRQMQEAPHEHLGRVLDPLGVRPEPVHELAELFVLARFSDEPVTDEHRVAAVAALESSLADLRAASRAREQANLGDLAHV